MPSIYVQDGYTLRGSVPADKDGVYPAVRFSYRPATHGIRFEYADATGPGARAKCAAAIVCRQLVSLEVLDGDNPPQPVTLTEEQLAKTPLHADLFLALFNHVMGYVGPDVSEKEKNSPPG
jgi:hypothetical protein